MCYLGDDEAQRVDVILIMLSINELKDYSYNLHDDPKAWLAEQVSALLDTVVDECAYPPNVLWIEPYPLVLDHPAGRSLIQGDMGVFWGAVDEPGPSRSEVLAQAIQQALADHTDDCSEPAFIPTADLVYASDCNDGCHYDSPGKDTNTATTHRIAERLAEVLQTGAKVKKHGTGDAASSKPDITVADKPGDEAAEDEEPQYHLISGANPSTASATGAGLQSSTPGVTWEDTRSPNGVCNGSITSENFATSSDKKQNNATCDTASADAVHSVMGWSLLPLVIFELLLFLFGGCSGWTEPGDEVTDAKSVTTIVDPYHPPTAVMAKPAPKRFYQGVNGVRVIAVLHIMVFHLFQVVYAPDLDPSNNHGTLHPAIISECSFCGFGKYWVQAFFLISGYVTSLSRNSRSAQRETWDSWKAQLTKRVLRVYPLYMFSLIFCCISVHATTGGGIDWKAFILSAFMVQSWFPPFYNTINGPAWFMSNLLFFWIFFPHWNDSIRSIANRNTTASLNCMSILLAGVWLATFMPFINCYMIYDLPLFKHFYGQDLHQFIEFSPLTNWPAFAMGVLLASMFKDVDTDIPQKLRQYGPSVICALLALFFSFATPPGFEMGTYKLLIDKGPISLPIFALLLLGVSAEQVEDKFAGTVLVWLGRVLSVFVWPAYIMHLSGQSVMNSFVQSLKLDTAPMIILFVCIFEAAWILFCHYCIDQPAKQLIEARRVASSNPGTPSAGQADQHSFKSSVGFFGASARTASTAPEPSLDDDWVQGDNVRGMSLMGSVL
jgi:peptidoglycan/LPS O-acetylase OafA/YrhL